LQVSLVGVSCVGTTTIGRILADRRGWPFFDLDEEIERHFGLSIGRLQARFLTGYSYRKECAAVLERIATATQDCVIALPASGLRDAFLRVVRRVPGVTVASTTRRRTSLSGSPSTTSTPGPVVLDDYPVADDFARVVTDVSLVHGCST